MFIVLLNLLKKGIYNFIPLVMVGSRVHAHGGCCRYRTQVSTIMPYKLKAEVILLDLAGPLTADIKSCKVQGACLLE